MLNQRFFTGFSAVVTTIAVIGVNVSYTYASVNAGVQNSRNSSGIVKEIAVVKRMTWNEVLNNGVKLMDLVMKVNNSGFIETTKKLVNRANYFVKQGLGNQQADANTVNSLASVVNSLRASDFNTPQMRRKLQQLQNRIR